MFACQFSPLFYFFPMFWSISIGSGKMIVEFRSAAIELRVWR